MIGTVLSDAVRRAPLAWLLLMCVLTAPRKADCQEDGSLGPALGLQRTLVDAIARAEPSLVSIARYRAKAPGPVQTEFGQFRSPLDDSSNPASLDYIPNEFGSGVLIAPEGAPDERYVLTNYHVVRGAAVSGSSEPSEYQLYVRFADRRGCGASIRAADPRSDLAVLDLRFNQLGRSASDLTPIPFARGGDYRKGQLVISLGNPYALARDGSSSASLGMIGNITRRPAPVGSPTDVDARRRETIHHFGTLLQIDTRQNLGTSGGALINLQGALIGITTSLAALEGYEKSVGFAVPLDEFTRRVISDLAAGHEVEYGFLGIQTAHVPPAKHEGMSRRFGRVSAALVDSVIPNSAAEAGGLRRGDVIVSVNNEPVYSPSDLIREVGRVPPDTSVRLRVWRERGEQPELNLTVHLGKWPVEDDEGIIATRPRYAPVRGLVVDFPTARRKFLQGLEYLDAVLVTEVVPNSRAAAADILPGDYISHVNGRAVQTPAEFLNEMQKHDGPVTVQLIDHRGPARTVTLPATE